MDQELRDLIEQLRDLNLVLKNMSKNPGQTSGTISNKPAETMVRSVDRMVVALGQLTVKLDTTKRTRREEEDAIKKFANAVERTATNLDNENKERQAATDALEKEIAARKEATRRSDMSRASRDLEDKARTLKKEKEDADQRNRDIRSKIEESRISKSSSRELFDSLSNTGGSAEVLKGRFYDLADNSMSAQIGLRSLGAVTEGASKSLKLFATGLINGERGAELSAKAATALATPLLELVSVVSGIATFASFLLPGGLLIKGLRAAASAALGLGAAAGKAGLALNELAAKQIDAQFKSFNALSQAGVRLQDGFIGVIDTMQTLGMTMSEVEQFNQLISENNRNLAIMGGTATKGAKQFSEVAGQLVKGELGKQLEYMGITQEEQRKATLSYMSIQARTGQLELNNTNKLIEGSANFIRELDLAAQMAGTTRKAQMEAKEAALAETRFRAALSMAIKEGNVAEINRLKRGQAIAEMMRGTLGEEQFISALQLTASGGALTTEGATALEVSTGFTQILNDTNLTVEEAFRQIVKQGVDFADGVGYTNALLGDIKGIQIASVPLRDEAARQLKMEQAAAGYGFTGPKAIERFTEFVKKNQDKVSKETRDLINANRAQQSATMTMERGLSEFNVSVGIHKAASETFANAVKMFGDAVGLKVPGGTPTFGGVPVESGVRLPPTVAAATAKVEQAKTTLKEIDVKIKEQEEKLKLAKTNVEKDQAEAEIKKLKSQLSDANKAKNAAELGQRSLENRNRLGGANQQLKSGGPIPMDAEAKERFKQQLKSGANVSSPESAKPTTSPTKILDLIGRAESGGNYNILVGGKTNADLTNMTIAQVLEYQSSMIQRGHETTAVGKYQIVQGTLQGLLKQGVVSPNEIFSPGTQDKLATALLNEKGWANFQSGKMSADQMADAIAEVWAGFPLASGRSFYQGVGSNKATVGRQEVLSALTDVPKARDGGVFRGPMSGYPAVLHGKEAVIPLKNGAVPVMLPALDELVSSNKAVDAQVQVLRNEMGSMMRELTDALMAMKESGSQQRMIQLLESISRSQQTTATASTKMAQLAAN